jgi:hypothetical protein
MHSLILAPVMALVLWSFVMLGWLYLARIPAIAKNNVVYDPFQPATAFHAQLPARVRWKGDNYAHLMEQPTVFYAVALILALVGAGDGLNADLAWGYVALRVVHSLVQVLINRVMIRFAIFSLSSLVLLAMAVRAAIAVF